MLAGKHGNLDLNRMQLFKLVVEVGSFSKASTILGLPKSNVSRNISILERELGTRLIYRTTRKFQLSEPGREFYQSIREHIEALENSIVQVSSSAQEISGKIRMTAPEDLGASLLSSVCEEFYRIHPKVQIEAILTNQRLDLVENSIDIGLRVGPLRDSTMVQKKIGRAGMLLAASPQFADRFSKKLNIQCLGDIPTLGFLPVKPVDRWELTSKKETKKIQIRPVFTTDNFILLRKMAVAGIGLALMPEFLCYNEISNGELVQVMPEWINAGAIVHLLMPSHKEASPRIKIFSNFLQEKLKGNFALLT